MSRCPECRSDNVYRHRKQTPSGGGDDPFLLPDLGRNMLQPAKMTVAVCADCGLIRIYVSDEARERLVGSDKWERM